MRLLYDATSGVIYHAVLNRDWFGFSHSTNLALTTLEIDEVDGNKTLCQDLLVRVNEHHRNLAGEEKYFVSGGQLNSRDGWIRYYPPRPKVG